MARVLTPENLGRAWHQVKANPGAPGVEGMTVEDFPVFAQEHGPSIRQALRDETYPPAPVRRPESPQRHGQGKRWLGMPTGVERVIQPALAQGLGPLFDPDFSTASCGFRPGRSAPHAVKQIQGYLKTGAKVAVDRDLAKFFDRVTPDALRARVARKVRDKAVLRLMGQYRRAGGLVGEDRQPTATGVPHGSPLSPWLSTLRLEDVAQELERRGHQFARYGDDFLLVGKSPRAGERVKASLTRVLPQPLKLESKESKSTVGPTKAWVFLGFTFPGTRI